MALIVQSNGRYRRALQAAVIEPAAPTSAQPGSPGVRRDTASAQESARGRIVEAGTWKRAGEVVEFVPDAPEAASARNATGTDASGPVAAGRPAWKVKIVSLSPRALAFEVEDGLMLFARP